MKDFRTQATFEIKFQPEKNRRAEISLVTTGKRVTQRFKSSEPLKAAVVTPGRVDQVVWSINFRAIGRVLLN